MLHEEVCTIWGDGMEVTQCVHGCMAEAIHLDKGNSAALEIPRS